MKHLSTLATFTSAGRLPCAFVAFLALAWPVATLADAEGMFQYTKRFDGESVVKEVDWFYDRSVPSLTFSETRVIWTGVGAPDGRAGSDGLFHNAAGELVVMNWEGGNFFKMNPEETDDVIEGPEPATFAFHTLLHPNLNDFLDVPALSGLACSGPNGASGCFGVNDHTPLRRGQLCLAPADLNTGDPLQPVSFIADENLNMFALYSVDESIQFGGGGFAAFGLADTDKDFCDPDMTMESLLDLGIESAHSISWSPFLSDANAAASATTPADHHVDGPHSDFIAFAHAHIGHIRVMNPGTENATAELVSEIDMTSEPACTMLLPGGNREFDQGAVTGDGIAIVADETTGYVALVDYRENQNGTIRDPENMVCLVAHLEEGIDDIAPLTGLGARNFFGPGNDGGGFPINAGHSGAWFEARTAGQGFFADFVEAANSTPAGVGGKTRLDEAMGFAFISWFTYTDGDSSNPFEQQWYTMQGSYIGDRAHLDIFETLGGEFDDTDPVVNNKVGTATAVMFSCTEGEIVYNFDDGRTGVIPIKRVIPGSEVVCDARASTSPQAIDINVGMDGSWFEPATAGQGFFMDVHLTGGLGKAQTTTNGTGFIFISWFTYGNNTASGQQWFTAQGGFDGSSADISIFETTDGSFDDPRAVDNEKVGTMKVDFDDCEHASIEYDFDNGPSGDIPLERVLPNGAALCNEMTSPN